MAALPVAYHHGAVVHYEDELTFRFPPGEADWDDELHVYRLNDLPAPDRPGELLKTYTVQFRSGRFLEQPVEIMDVEPGTHQVRLTLEGCQDFSASVTLEEGETGHVHGEMEEASEDYVPWSVPHGVYAGSIHGFHMEGSRGVAEITVDENLNASFHAEIAIVSQSRDGYPRMTHEIIITGSGVFLLQPNGKYHCHSNVRHYTTTHSDPQPEWGWEAETFTNEVEQVFPLWYYGGTISGFGEYHDLNIASRSGMIANEM